MSRRKIVKKNENIIKDEINNNEINNDFLNKIDQIYFINLEHRKDRLESILYEIKKFSCNFDKVTRVNGIKKDDGKLGCNMSHLKALENAVKNKYENIIIFEDDFVFTESIKEINENIKYLLENEKEYNICLLSANNLVIKNYNNFLVEAIDVQTTSGYIINKRFFETFINSIKEGILMLENGNKDGIIDMIWKKFQGENKRFFVFKNRLGKQKESYSNIENKIVNYNC